MTVTPINPFFDSTTPPSAREHWRHICAAMSERRDLDPLYFGLLTGLCHWYSIALESAEAFHKLAFDPALRQEMRNHAIDAAETYMDNARRFHLHGWARRHIEPILETLP